MQRIKAQLKEAECRHAAALEQKKRELEQEKEASKDIAREQKAMIAQSVEAHYRDEMKMAKQKLEQAERQVQEAEQDERYASAPRALWIMWPICLPG